MADNPWHYAVVVGIDQYPRIDAGSYDLKCPIRDAETVSGWLTSAQGGNLAPERVATLTRTIPAGRSPPVPVYDEINSAILGCVDDFLTRRNKELSNETERKKAWKMSRFYFYISGHGMAGDGDDAVLITANATRKTLNNISTRNVLLKLKNEKVFGELVVLADCCRELAAAEVQTLPWDLAEYRGYNDPILPRSFVAYASRNRKRAFEPPPGSAVMTSIFTRALIEGLEGGVPGNEVESKSLENFLYNYVPKLAEQLGTPPQNPEIRSDPGIIFVQTSKSYRVTLRAAAGSPFAALGSINAVETQGKLVRSRYTLNSSAPGVFTGTLPTGFYLAVASGADPFAGAPHFAFSVLGQDQDADIS